VSLAVLGTDTGVGKTVVSALILARYGRVSRGLAYWKPIATGGSRDRDASYIRSRLSGRAEVLEEEYLFDPPVSPHLAARKAGSFIHRRKIQAAWNRHRGVPGRAIVVEGIGGVLVPISDRGHLLADLIRSLELEAVLVARSTLGTINHTLLTLEALRSREIPLIGVVLNGPPGRDNREAIERFGKVKVLGEVPRLAPGRRPSRASLLAAARGFDRVGALEPYLLNHE